MPAPGLTTLSALNMHACEPLLGHPCSTSPALLQTMHTSWSADALGLAPQHLQAQLDHVAVAPRTYMGTRLVCCATTGHCPPALTCPSPCVCRCGHAPCTYRVTCRARCLCSCASSCSCAPPPRRPSGRTCMHACVRATRAVAVNAHALLVVFFIIYASYTQSEHGFTHMRSSLPCPYQAHSASPHLKRRSHPSATARAPATLNWTPCTNSCDHTHAVLACRCASFEKATPWKDSHTLVQAWHGAQQLLCFAAQLSADE